MAEGMTTERTGSSSSDSGTPNKELNTLENSKETNKELQNTHIMENVACVLKSGKDVYNYLLRFGPIVSISDGTGNGMMDTDTIQPNQ